MGNRLHGIIPVMGIKEWLEKLEGIKEQEQISRKLWEEEQGCVLYNTHPFFTINNLYYKTG